MKIKFEKNYNSIKFENIKYGECFISTSRPNNPLMKCSQVNNTTGKNNGFEAAVELSTGYLYNKADLDTYFGNNFALLEVTAEVR